MIISGNKNRALINGVAVSHVSTPDSPLKKVLINNLRNIRHQTGLPQDKFAEEIGVSISYLKAIERGAFLPSHEYIVIIADKFNISIDWIYGRGLRAGITGL